MQKWTDLKSRRAEGDTRIVTFYSDKIRDHRRGDAEVEGQEQKKKTGWLLGTEKEALAYGMISATANIDNLIFMITMFHRI
jgi:hypothetical protein